MSKVEKNKWPGYNQMDGRHNMSSIEPDCLNEIITEVHGLTRTPLCIHQDDAKGYYDRIIRHHTNLNNKKLLILDNVGKIYHEAYEKMESKTQLHNSIYKKSYTSTKSLPFHGAGEGAGNTGTEWTFISVPILKIAEELTEGCTIKLPQGKATWTIHILGFVDDKRHYVNNFKERVLQHSIDTLEQSIRTPYICRWPTRDG